MKYSTRFGRVWACGESPDFIKKQLRFVGESYHVYLRDTNKINQQYVKDLTDSSQAVMDLINSDIDSNI